jgi:carbon monoxide dehydrogenase subunit G
MEMSSVQIVPASPLTVWSALNDPLFLKACIPGCQQLEQVADNEYRIAMAVRVGPVSAKFSGKIILLDLNPIASYTLNFEGQGGIAGFAKGTAKVLLSPEASATRMAYSASAQIGGKLAQIGSRLVDGAANKMATEFFTALARELEAAPRTAAPETPGTAETPEAPEAAGTEGPGQMHYPQEGQKMDDEAKGFKVRNVQMQEIPSPERGHDGTAESAQKAVMSAEVECLRCGEKWIASEDAPEKSLSNVLGGIVLSCPKCNQTGGVQRPDFD